MFPEVEEAEAMEEEVSSNSKEEDILNNSSSLVTTHNRWIQDNLILDSLSLSNNHNNQDWFSYHHLIKQC